MKGPVLSLLTLSLLSSCALLQRVGIELSPQSLGKEREETFFQRVWAKNLDPPYKTGNLPIGTLAPTIHEDILFQGSLTGDFWAYSLSNGRPLWKVREKEAISSPGAVFGKYIIYSDLSGRLHARHYLTGKLIYRFDVGSAVEGKIVFSKGRGFVHTRNHSLVSFDGATGKILWSFKRNIPYSATIQGVATPVVYRDRLIVGLADGYLASFSLKDGPMIWEKKISKGSKFVDVDMVANVKGKALHVGPHGGNVLVLDPLSGKIMGRFDVAASAPPLLTHGKIFLGSDDGQLYVFTEGARLSKTLPLNPNSPITHIILWKGNVVATDTKGYLYQIDPKSLKILSKLHLGHKDSAVYGNLSWTKKYLAVMGARNRLYVFQ
ncbi:MAG: PQQ-binding-like beta-propeller repeat protein [Bacteriovoracales bacterium]|nr:PQQ-binding-like beta-propeller repeat protein [Bacteriovoracales bacterium]